MASDGTITFSTALDNSQLEKGIKAAEREVKRIEEKVSRAETTKSGIEKQMEAAEAAIKETGSEIDRLNAKMAGLGGVSGTREGYEAQRAEIEGTASALAAAQARMESQVAGIDKLNGQWQKADERARAYTEQLGQAKSRAAELGAEYQRSMARAASSADMVRKRQSGIGEAYAKSVAAGTMDAGKSLSASEARFAQFSKRIKTMMKDAFIFSGVLVALNAVKEHLAETMKENDRFAASYAVLMATMKGFAAPLVNAATAALTGLMNMLSRMLATLAQLIDSVFRTDLSGSIKAARAAAQAAEREAKAKKKTAKAAKEAAKSIMAFDEINAMQADKKDEKDDEPAEKPLDFDALGAGKIDEALGAIMAVLGAALLAVGAILCFSGINIPLGITLMAVGALMLYTAVQEQWGKLPAEVREAITTALVIGGLLCLVVGAVLAFSGVNVPLGVGLIAAGAVMLGAAVALNWGSMSAETQGVVSVMMGILGAALLVIGAILTFTAANPMLGVGLMILGAAVLAAVVALNWQSMPEEVQGVVSAIMLIVGIAFLVLGVVLAFAAPGAWGLALGLIIVGAAALAGAVALNWEKMPQEVRDTVSTIMGIVGGAIVVIGVILLFTGAGIPLGVGCILAGAGLLAADAALNWDFLKDKIAEIWASICRFWDDNIAQVFTEQFWEDLWKSMVNGLIWAINSGLSAFGGFLNDISAGIGGLLGAVGINDWSGWNVQMPQIPYLAQGAVIPPNRKFAAVLGDQTSGNNLEAPESLIRQIVREEAGGFDADALAWAVQQGVAMAIVQAMPSQRAGDSDATMVLQVDGEELARAVARGNASLMWKGALSPEIQFA